MKKYDFSPLQKTPGKITFPIVIHLPIRYKILTYILVVFSWIITGLIIFFPLFNYINGRLETGLFIITLIFGVPLTFLSSRKTKSIFYKHEFVGERLEILEDRILIMNDGGIKNIILFEDILTFSSLRHPRYRLDTTTIKMQNGNIIKISAIDFYNFMAKNFTEENSGFFNFLKK